MAIESAPVTKEVVIEQRTREITIRTPRDSEPTVEFHRERNEIVDDVVEHTSNDPAVILSYSEVPEDLFTCDDGTKIGKQHVAQFLKFTGDTQFLIANPPK